MGEFDDEIFFNLPTMTVDRFDVLYDEKPHNRRWNRTASVPMDADMYIAIQELAANKELPFQGNMSALGRHVFAAGIDSLRLFLTKDTRTLWSALQSNQRRLTAERYVLTAEEQVRDAAELLERWTADHEWDAVYADVSYAAQALDELPLAAWRRRIAKEWMSNADIRRLLTAWQQSMPEEAPETWRLLLKTWNHFRRVAEGE